MAHKSTSPNFFEIQGYFLVAKYRFWYCRMRRFSAQKFNRRTNVEPCTNVKSKPFSPAFGNTLLEVRAFLSMMLPTFIFGGLINK